MRRIAFACALMMIPLFFGACGNEEMQNTGSQIQAYYANLDRIYAQALVSADFGDTVSQYRLVYDCDAGTQQSVMVVDPEIIRGIKAVVSGDDASLEFEDVILDTGSPGDLDITPVGCLPALREAWCAGYIDSVWRESLSGRDCVVMDIQTFENPSEVIFRTWFDQDGFSPVYAEIISGGNVLIQCEFEEFAPDGQEKNNAD